MNLIQAATLTEALRNAPGESLSEKLSTLKISNVVAIKSNRGYEVLVFTDDENCKNYGGFLAGHRIISPSKKKGTVKGTGFYEGDFRHGQCDPSGHTVWIAFDEDNGVVKSVGGNDGFFDLRKKGFITESWFEKGVNLNLIFMKTETKKNLKAWAITYIIMGIFAIFAIGLNNVLETIVNTIAKHF